MKRASRSAQQMARISAAIQPRRLQRIQRPHIDEHGGRHAEIDEVGERIEFGAEARCAFEQARKPAIDGIEHDGEDDRADRQFVAAFDAEPDGGDAAAQRQQRDEIGQQEADRASA